MALTSKIYCTDKAGEETRDGCACFLSLPSLSFPRNHCEFSRKCTDLHVCCQQAHAVFGPLHPGSRAEQPAHPSTSQAGPSSGVLWWVPGSRRGISILPPWPEAFLGMISYSTEGAFSYSRGKTLLRRRTLLSSTSFYCFFKQNTIFCL